MNLVVIYRLLDCIKIGRSRSMNIYNCFLQFRVGCF